MDKIAIVGMACRFPGGGSNLEGYWELLEGGDCAITEIPGGRWSLEGFYDPRPDIPTRSYSKWGGFLSDVKSFDPAFFELSPREAETMDPQQRLLLEITYEAVQDAGLTLQNLREQETGVFIGASNVDYGLLQRFRSDRGDTLAGTGTALSIIANRISNTLSLTGPSLVTDTACSSSLVALDTACRHLRDGTCDVALVGGVNVLLDPRMFITFSRAHMLSPSGRIRAFDASADGFVRGEGAGLIVLRRSGDARVRNKAIYATVEATAINQDGGTGTITAPNPDAQIAMMQTVLKRASACAGDVVLAEAHGTGTPVGDPIEVGAIGAVFGGPDRDAPLLIGSSKTNLGHLEPAAGMAGLIKAALALSRRELPPTISFNTPNPNIDFDKLNIEVAAGHARQLPSGNSHSRAMGLVNSFGFGGTNACALLATCNDTAQTAPVATGSGPQSQWSLTPDVARPYPLSAPTEEHLRAYAGVLAERMSCDDLGKSGCSGIGHALGTQRDNFDCRAVIIARSRHDLYERLIALSEGRAWPRQDKTDPPGIVTGHAAKCGKLAFTMTGQGGQWWAMGRALLKNNSPFAAFFETFDGEFQPLSGWSVIDAMMADEAESQLDDAAITPAVMFAFQCGLAAIWRSIGVTPDLVAGHSFGEVTAAYLAGSISLQHVAKLVLYRGLIRGDVDRVGTMAAIGLGADDVRPLLPADGSVEIGGYNAPNLVTLTGEERAIDDFIAMLNRDDPNIVTRKLALDFAYHSSWFEPVEDLFKQNVGVLEWSSPDIPVISTVTGLQNDRFDADYWWSNLRYPVRYQEGVRKALELGAGTFVELGPTRTLSSMTAGCAAAENVRITTTSTLHRRWDDFESIATAVGELYCAGHEVDWCAIHEKPHALLHLPRQPWLKKSYWHEPPEARRALINTVRLHYLLGSADDGPGRSWTQMVSLESHGFLSDHRINDQIVYPAACYTEMIYEAASRYLSTDRIDIRRITFPSALYISPGDEVKLRTVVDEARNRINIFSRHCDRAAQWQHRANAHVLPLESTIPPFSPESGMETIETRCFYDAIADRGYQYGPQFRHLGSISASKDAARARLEPGAMSETDSHDTTLPAPLLDSAFQLMLATSLSGSGCDYSHQQYLPVEIDRIRIAGKLASGCEVSADVQHPGDLQDLVSNYTLQYSDGSHCATITNLRARSVGKWRGSGQAATDAVKFYREYYVPWTQARPAADASGPWLILENNGARLVDNVADAVQNVNSIDSTHRNTPHTLEAARAHWISLLEDTLDGHAHLSGIIYRPSVISVEGDCGQKSAHISLQNTHALIGLGQAIQVAAEQFTLPHIWTIVRGAEAVINGAAHDSSYLQHASFPGCIRSIQMECPDLRYHLVTLNDRDPRTPKLLTDVLTSGTDETEFTIAEGTVRVSRLESADDLTPRTYSSHSIPEDLGFSLSTMGATGDGFDSLHWVAKKDSPPGDEEVQIDISHTGVNFRDVMAVAGILPPDAEATPAVDALGLEFSGTVSALGRNVTGFSKGDRVFSMARGALTRRIKLPPGQVYRSPDSLTDAETATLCSAYLTAEYALNRIGHLQKGERILIHNGSGAVGLAAVSLARSIGAEIITTAGKPDKRRFLRESGLDNVLDSRSLSFADDVLDLTSGRGVDVILNALSGSFIDRGLDCLSPYGRFLEIGKSDVYGDRALGLRSLRANQSLHVIDVAALLSERPRLVRQIMEELLFRFNDGTLAPLPHAVFPASKVEAGFRHFAAADHIGKVVIDQSGADTPVVARYSSGAGLNPNGTYLVTGGTRGMGLAVARWLRANGAGHVIAASKSGTPDLPGSGKGTATSHPDDPHECCALDVTDTVAVVQKLEEIQLSDKPLRGVIHAAVVYADALLPEMSGDAVAQVFGPKAEGAVNLTQALISSAATPDFFVSFSSAAHATGWPGQSNYTAANSVLEALTHFQRTNGIPGQCINWGVFGDTGHVADSEAMSSYLENSGWGTLENELVCKLLARVLDHDEPTMTIATADWSALAALHAPIARSPRLAQLCAGGKSDATLQRMSLWNLNGDMSEHAARIVREQVGKVLRVNADTLADYETISDAGIDSLSAFELRNRLEQETNLKISLGRFVGASRFDELTALLCALAKEQAGQVSAAAPSSG